jgi:hypothetical protein
MFYKCTNLQNIVFGEKVEKIANRAFYGCTALTEISIPDTVKTIEQYAFYKCSNVETLNLGNGVETIGRSAFTGCSKVEFLYIPANVKTIEKQAFRNLHTLKSVVVADGVETVNDYAFYGCKLVTFYLEADSIPETWTKRWNSAYRPVVLGATLSNEGYVVSFVKNSGTVLNTNAKMVLQEPVREGYKCVGWSKSASAQTAEYVGNEVLDVADGTVLYAVWKPIEN